MTDPNISAKIEGCTPLPLVGAGKMCGYCGARFIHTPDCIHLMVNVAFDEMDMFWPMFPDRGIFTTFNDHYGEP